MTAVEQNGSKDGPAAGRAPLHLPSVWDGPMPGARSPAIMDDSAAPPGPDTAESALNTEIRSIVEGADRRLAYDEEPAGMTESGTTTGQRVPVLIDADVVAFFEATGAGAEKQINDALRAYVRALSPD